MLLSIDKVLQLLAEGKTTQKIAEIANVDNDDVVRIIEDARALLDMHDKARVRKKVIFKKRPHIDADAPAELPGAEEEENALLRDIFEGAELSAVPFESQLVINADGASRGNPGPSGIGIVICDGDDRQVGKVSAYIGENTNNFAEYSAIIRAMKIGLYYKARALRIRTDSELVVKQIKGEYKVNNENIRPLYEEAVRLKKLIGNCKIEHVTRNYNDKADFLAKKAASSGGAERR
ncbi:MAG: ribonuclease HI family protein [Spirochaetes bacterium]|nr:MAG: ribonuclease HI family protein [Spirochaetota bacterium]